MFPREMEDVCGNDYTFRSALALILGAVGVQREAENRRRGGGEGAEALRAGDCHRGLAHHQVPLLP